MYKFKWFKDTNLINHDFKKFVSLLILLKSLKFNSIILNKNLISNGTLVIKDTNKSDIGLYKCFISFNSKSTLARTIYLKDESSIIRISPQNLKINQLSSVSLECLVLKNAKSITYTWYKDNFYLNSTNINRFDIKNSSDIDSGIYKCEACINENQECFEAQTRLFVQSQLKFTKQLPSVKNIAEYHDVEFECLLNTYPNDVKITWFKNAQPLNKSDFVIFNDNKSKMMILGVNKSDEGYYQCIVSNLNDMIYSFSHLKTSKSFNSTLSSHVDEPKNLKIIKISSEDAQISWNLIDNAQFYQVILTSDSYRKREFITLESYINLEYLKPNKKYKVTITPFINSEYKGKSSEIVLRTLDRIEIEKTHLESLEAQSSLLQTKSIKASNLMSRMVKSTFKGPSDLKYNLINSQSIKLKWTMNSNDNKILKFRLYYSQKYLVIEGNDDYSVDKFIDISLKDIEEKSLVYEHEIDELKKYSQYKLKLFAVNNLNELSEPSNEITFNTPSDVPDLAPEITKFNVINQTSIEINWKAPLYDKQNGDIISYRLNIKEYSAENESTRIINVPSKYTSKIINDLNAGIKYLVRITARNQNGTGPYSQWIVVKTFQLNLDETRVPDQPSELTAEPTDTSIYLRWTPPEDSNEIVVRKYLLKYGQFIPTNEIEIDGTKDSYLLSNLNPSSQYIISLKAGNKFGYGREILKEVITKRKSVLSDSEFLFPPLNLQAQTISQHIIELSWIDWHLRNNEDIPDDRFYKIRYSLSSSNDQLQLKYKYKNSTERRIQLDDLKPDTLYDFAVKLIAGKRESEWSMTTSQMTMEAIKGSIPIDIKLKSDFNQNSIEKKYINIVISWKMSLINNNDDDSVFVISYADKKSFEENNWKQETISKSIAIDNVYIDDDNMDEIDDENSNLIKMQAQIRQLKLDTIYYFKIEEKTKHEYLSQSPIVLYKTPNSEGYGERIIFDIEKYTSTKETLINKKIDSNISKISIEINLIWIIAAISITILLVIIILVGVMCTCKRDKTNAQNQKYIFIKKPDEDSAQKLNLTEINVIDNEMSKFISLNTNNSQTSSSCNTNSNNPWSNQTTHTSSINLSNSIASGQGVVPCQSHLGSLSEHQQQYAPLSSTSSVLGGQNMLMNDEFDNFESASNAPSSLISRNQRTFASTRKSYKNLASTQIPTLIPNTNLLLQQQQQQTHMKTYTARPYLIDHQTNSGKFELYFVFSNK